MRCTAACGALHNLLKKIVFATLAKLMFTDPLNTHLNYTDYCYQVGTKAPHSLHCSFVKQIVLRVTTQTLHFYTSFLCHYFVCRTNQP
uniref:Putative secreted protein n=1 Tax=Rhipicephalus microplus TaxID=6941 RepID=A0A6M2DBI7_RHIMP